MAPTLRKKGSTRSSPSTGTGRSGGGGRPPLDPSSSKRDITTPANSSSKRTRDITTPANSSHKKTALYKARGLTLKENNFIYDFKVENPDKDDQQTIRATSRRISSLNRFSIDSGENPFKLKCPLLFEGRPVLPTDCEDHDILLEQVAQTRLVNGMFSMKDDAAAIRGLKLLILLTAYVGKEQLDKFDFLGMLSRICQKKVELDSISPPTPSKNSDDFTDAINATKLSMVENLLNGQQTILASLAASQSDMAQAHKNLSESYHILAETTKMHSGMLKAQDRRRDGMQRDVKRLDGEVEQIKHYFCTPVKTLNHTWEMFGSLSETEDEYSDADGNEDVRDL
jgi:hypothetical protein